MAKKKGMSLEEKRKALLKIYLQKQEPLKLQEIEKLGMRAGVNGQTIKDVNQSLVDDNLIEADKIGAGMFFWSLPSKGLTNRTNLIGSLDKQTESKTKELEEQKTKLDEEIKAREDPDDTRDDKLDKIDALKQRIEEAKKKMAVLDKNDPEKIKKMNDNIKVAKEAVERWTDNLFEVKSWIQKKTGYENREICKNFPIFKDLDYLES